MGARLERFLGPVVLVAGVVLIATGDVGWGVAIVVIAAVGTGMTVASAVLRRRGGG